MLHSSVPLIGVAKGLQCCVQTYKPLCIFLLFIWLANSLERTHGNPLSDWFACMMWASNI